MVRKLLRFGNNNAKLSKDVFTLSLPAGYSCPFAKQCLSKSDRATGKIKDGRHTTFRCFSASQEALYPNVRESRWGNYEALKGLSRQGMTKLILASLPRKASIVRPHVSGDFFSQSYFDAWLEVAKTEPERLFYFYTKALKFWVARLVEVGDGHSAGLVANFVPTASRGGKDDHLIDEYHLRSAIVVLSEAEANGLALDHDDTHAMKHGPDFGLLIHGPQPAGSEAAKAISALRAQGEWGYGKMADKRRVALTVV
jgi:hypothetical protein